MSWRASPSCALQFSNPFAALPLGRRCVLWSPWNLRGISTSTTLQEVQSEVDATRMDLRIVPSGDYPQTRFRPSRIPQLKPPPSYGSYIRCGTLLTSGNRYTNQKVIVCGMIKSIRKQKHGAFAHLTDGSCFQAIQVVLDPYFATQWVSFRAGESSLPG